MSLCLSLCENYVPCVYHGRTDYIHTILYDLAVATIQSTLVLSIVYSVLYELPLVKRARIGYAYFIH